jgi:hypothetical protein
MITEKQFRDAAQDIQTTMNLIVSKENPVPFIDPKMDLETLISKVQFALTDRREDDVFQPDTWLVINEVEDAKRTERPVEVQKEEAENDDLFKQIESVEKVRDLKDIAIANIEFKSIRGNLDKYKLEELRDKMFEMVTQSKLKPLLEKLPVMTQDLKIKIEETPKELIINPILLSACPPLSSEELTALEELCIKDGKIIQPLIVWNGQLVDGHNRYNIAKKHNLSFTTQEKQFASELDAILWIKENALSQRNLPDFAKIEMMKEIEDLLSEEGRKNKAHGLTAPGKSLLTEMTKEKDEHHNTRKKLAATTGISETQIAKAKVIQKKADEQTKEKLRKGETTIGKEYNKVTGKKNINEITDFEKVQLAAEDLQKWAVKYEKNPYLADIIPSVLEIAETITNIVPF